MRTAVTSRRLPTLRSPAPPMCKHITECRSGGRYRCHRLLTQAAFVRAAPRRPAGTELLGPSLTPRNTGKSMPTHNCLLSATIAPFILSLLSFSGSSDLFLHCSRPVGSEPTQGTHTKDERMHFMTARLSRKRETVTPRVVVATLNSSCLRATSPL